MNPNNALKIIIAVHHFPPTFKGGAEWRAYRTAHWLQAQGHTVKVICVESINDQNTTGLRWVDNTHESLNIRYLYMNLDNAPSPSKWEYDNSWIENHFAQYFAIEKPDIFHLISGYLMTSAVIKAAQQFNIPTVVTLTDFWFLCPRITLQRSSGQLCAKNSPLDCVRCKFEKKRRFRLPAQKLPKVANTLWNTAGMLPAISKEENKINTRTQTLQTTLSQVNVAICPSNFLKETYINRGFYAQQMKFLRQGLVYPPHSPVEKSPSSYLRVGYVGQIAPHKGVHTLIAAFKKLNVSSRKVQLNLYGDTNQFPDYFQTLQNMAINRKEITFAGTFTHQQIDQIYQNIDVLVVPSVWYENSPNVILEAFAYKTPVIASNLGGMAELIEDGKTGYLFLPGTPSDLAKKLQVIVDTPAVLNNLQENIVSPKTLETEMAELTSIYQALVSN